MYISLLICCLLVKWGFLCVHAGGNCTQECTLKQHLQCQMSASPECPRQYFNSLQPGKPTDLQVTKAYIFNPARPFVCEAALNVTWRVPSDASRLYVKAFQLQVFYVDEPGRSTHCIYYNLSQAHWTDDDEQIQYFYQCWTLAPGAYEIQLSSLPYNLHGSDTTIGRQFTVEKVYPGHDGSCVLPPSRTPSTTLKPRRPWHLQRPPTPPHKLNVRLILIVTGGCVLFVALSTFVLLVLWRRLSPPDDHDDTEPIWNNGMPQSGLNNAVDDHPFPGFIPPSIDKTSVSTEVMNNEIGDFNRHDAYYASRLPPSENVCNRFDGSICCEHSSERNCGCCESQFESQFESQLHPDLACPEVVYEGGRDHHFAHPGVGYGAGARSGPGVGYFDGARSGPGMGYNGEGFESYGRGALHHGPNNFEIDYQSVSGGHV